MILFSSPLRFLPALSPMLFFRSAFELCLLGGAWLPRLLVPAARQTDKLGDRKWKPISHHLCAGLCFFFFKSSGNQIDLSALNVCVPDNRVRLCAEFEMRPFHVLPADFAARVPTEGKTYRALGEAYQ